MWNNFSTDIKSSSLNGKINVIEIVIADVWYANKNFFCDSFTVYVAVSSTIYLIMMQFSRVFWPVVLYLPIVNKELIVVMIFEDGV